MCYVRFRSAYWYRCLDPAEKSVPCASALFQHEWDDSLMRGRCYSDRPVWRDPIEIAVVFWFRSGRRHTFNEWSLVYSVAATAPLHLFVCFVVFLLPMTYFQPTFRNQGLLQSQVRTNPLPSVLPFFCFSAFLIDKCIWSFFFSSFSKSSENAAIRPPWQVVPTRSWLVLFVQFLTKQTKRRIASATTCK